MRRAWILLVLWLFGQGYTQTSIDYAADFGGFEYSTTGTGIADGWSVWRNFGGSASHEEVGLFFQLTRSRAVEGQRSQEIRIARVAEEGEMFTCSAGVIRPHWDTAFLPPLGTPLLVRLWVQTENLTNVNIRVLAVTGQRTVVLAQLPANSMGWTPISAVVPLEANAEGRPWMDLRVEFTLRDNASGRVWLDGVQVLRSGVGSFARSRPNSLRIAHYNAPVSHWQALLDPTVDFLIAPLGQIQAISKYLPDSELGVYFNAAQTSDRQPLPWHDLYGGYHHLQERYPHWFLRRSGIPFNNPGYPYLWPLDIGLPEVRSQFVQRFLQIHQMYPLPKWIFLDDTGAYWQCDQYPDLNSNQQAWTGFFSHIIPAIHQQTNRAYRFIMNSGSWAGRFVDGNPGQQWITYFDGVMLEHVLVFYRRNNGGEYIYQPYRHNRATLHMTDSTWWGTLRAINAFPDKAWVIVSMCDADENPAMFRYILASYFIMMHSNTFLMVEDRRTAGTGTYYKWLRRPEPWVPLGNPRGRWYILAGTVNDHTGALFARDFENGIVIVNPTENQTYEYTLPRTYKNWDGQVVPAGTRISIGPKTGLAFYAAPEIKITISPQQITALPGETVTFTVRYHNDGLVSATNVKISVPLPDGLEFISSSSGGQYSERQVSWTLPSVGVGQVGTLTFQARIQ